MDCLEQQLSDALRDGSFDYSRLSPEFITAFVSGYLHHLHEIRSGLRADLRTVIADNQDLEDTVAALRGVPSEEETHQ